jgi:hypothetical protein
MLEAHKRLRQDLKAKEEAMHFSFDLETSLTEEERRANEKLERLRKRVADEENLN